jgi:phosphoglycolate phosphatase
VKRFSKIFFDLDGTLLDSQPGIENGIRHALNSFGINNITSREIRSIIGTPLPESLRKNYFSNEQDVWEAVKRFREYYSTQGLYESRPYAGVEEILSHSSAIAETYVLTAKPIPFAVKMLTHHKLIGHFKEVFGCNLNDASFSKADCLIQVAGKNAIMIGDKKEDILAGKAASTQTAGVLYGYGLPEEITSASPNHIIPSVQDLKNFFLL